MSAKGEAVKPECLPEKEPAESFPTRWSTEDGNLEADTQRAIEEAREKISRSIRKAFEPAE